MVPAASELIRCEWLEPRRLLAGPDISIFYDANGDNQINESTERSVANGVQSLERIELGTTTETPQFSSNIIRVKNDGDAGSGAGDLLEHLSDDRSALRIDR